VPTVVLTAALALGAAACLPPNDPATNGRMPDGSLTTISPSCRVANDVAPQLQALISAAAAAGVNVRPETKNYTAQYFPGVAFPEPPESCYRSFDGQVWWRNFYCFFGACQFAAVPGTSIHGWGRAVDFEDFTGELTFGSPGYAWLQAHAGEYGFFHPGWAEPGGSSPEAWHWEHG
jgi:hypothetical protein